MIRGNETAIELGLDIAAATYGARRSTFEDLVIFINAARDIVGGAPVAVTKQDLWYIEHRALAKMRRRSRARSLAEFAGRISEELAA